MIERLRIRIHSEDIGSCHSSNSLDWKNNGLMESASRLKNQIDLKKQKKQKPFKHDKFLDNSSFLVWVSQILAYFTLAHKFFSVRPFKAPMWISS